MNSTATVTWRHDGGIEPDGTVGGDGAGEAVSIRYVTDDAPARVTSYYYTVDTFERGGLYDDDETVDHSSRYVVESMVTLYVHEAGDPDAETYCDYEYGEGSYLAYATEGEATAARDAMARREYALGAALCISWDGAPR